MNNKLQELKTNISNKPKVTITYFIPDIKKTGGKYITKIGNLKKIDEYKQSIILEDRTEIPIKEVIEILY